MSDVQRSWATTLETVNVAQMQETDFLNHKLKQSNSYLSQSPTNFKFYLSLVSALTVPRLSLQPSASNKVTNQAGGGQKAGRGHTRDS